MIEAAEELAALDPGVVAARDVVGADLLVRGASRVTLSFGPAMLSFVPPLTVVTLVVVMLRPAPPAGTRSS